MLDSPVAKAITEILGYKIKRLGSMEEIEYVDLSTHLPEYPFPYMMYEPYTDKFYLAHCCSTLQQKDYGRNLQDCWEIVKALKAPNVSFTLISQGNEWGAIFKKLGGVEYRSLANSPCLAIIGAALALNRNKGSW